MSVWRRVKGGWSLVLLTPALVGAASGSELPPRVDPETGLKSWRYQGDGLGIELVQVPPDFIRASYAARGLPGTVSEAVAGRCVFGTIVRNLSQGSLAYRVADWRYRAADGVERPIKTKSEWLAEWHAMGVRFSWSILADAPTFEPGDWIQGFTTIAEPHGSRLDLKVTWSTGGEPHEKYLVDLECAPAPAVDG
jgi:hypothetical protein